MPEPTSPSDLRRRRIRRTGVVTGVTALALMGAPMAYAAYAVSGTGSASINVDMPLAAPPPTEADDATLTVSAEAMPTAESAEPVDLVVTLTNDGDAPVTVTNVTVGSEGAVHGAGTLSFESGDLVVLPGGSHTLVVRDAALLDPTVTDAAAVDWSSMVAVESSPYMGSTEDVSSGHVAVTGVEQDALTGSGTISVTADGLVLDATAGSVSWDIAVPMLGGVAVADIHGAGVTPVTESDSALSLTAVVTDGQTQRTVVAESDGIAVAEDDFDGTWQEFQQAYEGYVFTGDLSITAESGVTTIDSITVTGEAADAPTSVEVDFILPAGV